MGCGHPFCHGDDSLVGVVENAALIGDLCLPGDPAVLDTHLVAKNTSKPLIINDLME